MDTEDIVVTSKDDLSAMCVDGLYKFNFKFYGFLFILFLFVNSEIFCSRVLYKVNGLGEDKKTPSTWGMMVQALILVILCIIVDLLIRNNIV